MYTVDNEDDILVLRNKELLGTSEETRRPYLELLSSYGYVFMPYHNRFQNPYNGQYFKIDVLKSSLPSLAMLLAKEPLMSTKELEHHRDAYFRKVDKWNPISQLVGGMAFMGGLLLYAVSAILWLFGDVLYPWSLAGQFVGICLVHGWISVQHLAFAANDDFAVAPLYRNREVLLKAVRLAMIAMTLTLAWRNYDGWQWWVAVGSGFAGTLAINYVVSRHLEISWWAIHGLRHIDDLYGKHPLS